MTSLARAMFLSFIFSLLLLFTSVPGALSSGVNGPLTQDLQNWLEVNGYSTDDFVRSDYGVHGSYGGKSASAPNSTHTPVIFIHGNSDSALQTDSFSTGWDNSIQYFTQQGYTTADLYATSWGNNKAMQASTRHTRLASKNDILFRTHNCHEVQRLRRFFQAVLAYTGAPKVSFVTHSMGVTLGRKIIKGGSISAADGNCNVGTSLANKVDVFVGLAGANYGLCSCAGTMAGIEATCNKKDGFWPGDKCGTHMLCGLHPMSCATAPTYSAFLTDLNKDLNAEGSYVFSAWSNMDDLIQNNDYVWGQPTSLIPTSTNHKVYPSYTHMQTKEKTAADQYKMVHDKVIQ